MVIEMVKQTALIFFGLALATPISIAQAETLIVPLGQQAAEKQNIQRPQQGMTKTQVQESYGQPKDWRDAVGEPPISSWAYEDFTVYFEYDRVIHSVLRHQAIN